MAEAYIVDALRTPTGRRKGGLAHVHGADLGAGEGGKGHARHDSGFGHRAGERGR